MNAITIDAEIYKGIEIYAKMHNVNINQLVEDYLRKLLAASAVRTKKELPDSWKKMRGISADVADKDDEKLNCLLAKYK